MPRITAPKPHWLAALLSLLWMGSASLQAAPQLTPLHNRPVAFEENRGQTDPQVKYLSRGQGYTLFLTPEEAVLALHGAGQTGSILRLRWVDGVASPRMTADGPLPGVTHYLTGNDPSRWRTGVPSWERVRYGEVWPGIDLVFYGNPRQLEYDVVVAPGADPGRVRLAFEGAEELRLEPAGDLVVQVGGEEVRLHRPVSSQEVNGARRSIESSWRLIPGVLEAGFRVGAYDRSWPLVIDPVLVYSTYLGGSLGDSGNDIAVDAAGMALAAGAVPSLEAQDPPALVFSTFFGTPWEDEGSAVAVDLAAFTYVAGLYDADPYAETGDAFVLKVAPGGGRVWSVRLGGSGWDEAVGVAVGAAGDVWVAGRTRSPDFPVVDPWQPAGPGGPFLARLSPAGELEFSTVYGGSGGVGVTGIGMDARGFLYLAGATTSPTFPPGTRGTGSLRAYVLKIDPAGPRIVWGAEVENPGAGWLVGFAVDPAGRAYLGWETWTARLNASGASLDYLVPIGGLNGLAADAAGNAYRISSVVQGSSNTDILLQRLGPTGERTGSLILGGSWDDWPSAIATDPAGDVYIGGETSSADFPLEDPVQASCPAGDWPLSCWPVGFLARIRPDTWEIRHSTYLGGGDTIAADEDRTRPLALAARHGALTVAGWTTDADFPVVNAFQPVIEKGYAGITADAFVTRIAFNQPPACSAAFASPSTLWPPDGRMVPVAILGVTDPDGDPVTLRVTAIHQDEPLSRKEQPDATGLGTATPALRAGRAGSGDGRVYHIAFEATDPAGAACTGTVTVCVPHDRGRQECGDGGALVPSTRF